MKKYYTCCSTHNSYINLIFNRGSLHLGNELATDKRAKSLEHANNNQIVLSYKSIRASAEVTTK